VKVRAHTRVDAPPEAVWAFVDDPERYLHFMAGITRWERADGPARGRGARYRTLMRVGSAEVGGLVEVVEHRPPGDLAWSSVTGIAQRGRWRLRPLPGGGTSVELRLAYGVSGPAPIAWVATRLAARTVGGHLRSTLAQLRRQVEHEQTRAAAAERRALRDGVRAARAEVVAPRP
jgi:uncharacterized membrane protein